MNKTYLKIAGAVAAIAISLPLLVFSQGTSSPARQSTCPLITTYMNLGRADNRPEQVARLQTFLRNTEKLDVDINGVFDQKTDAAVRAFQAKYADTILTPWGGTKTSGYVYITTSKKINELACSQQMSLNASELAAIDTFKTKTDGAMTGTSMMAPEPATSSPTAAPAMQDKPVMSDNNDSMVKDDTMMADDDRMDQSDEELADDGMMAASADATMAAKLWAFIKGLFN